MPVWTGKEQQVHRWQQRGSEMSGHHRRYNNISQHRKQSNHSSSGILKTEVTIVKTGPDMCAVAVTELQSLFN